MEIGAVLGRTMDPHRRGRAYERHDADRAVDGRLWRGGWRLRGQCAPLRTPTLLLHRTTVPSRRIGLALLYGLGVLPLGANGWTWIGSPTLAAALVLCFGLDALFGKYIASRMDEDNDPKTG